jgi:hypothetical protein
MQWSGLLGGMFQSSDSCTSAFTANTNISTLSTCSARVLTPEHAEAAYDHVLRSYYMHFRMYKYCLTSKPKLHFMQNYTAGLNTPERLLQYPLNDAIEIPSE